MFFRCRFCFYCFAIVVFVVVVLVVVVVVINGYCLITRALLVWIVGFNVCNFYYSNLLLQGLWILDTAVLSQKQNLNLSHGVKLSRRCCLHGKISNLWERLLFYLKEWNFIFRSAWRCWWWIQGPTGLRLNSTERTGKGHTVRQSDSRRSFDPATNSAQ